MMEPFARVPGTPAPASGAVYLFPEAKVHAVD